MQKFLKSVKIWQSYREFTGGTFFWDTVYLLWMSCLRCTGCRLTPETRSRSASLFCSRFPSCCSSWPTQFRRLRNTLLYSVRPHSTTYRIPYHMWYGVNLNDSSSEYIWPWRAKQVLFQRRLSMCVSVCLCLSAKSEKTNRCKLVQQRKCCIFILAV